MADKMDIRVQGDKHLLEALGELGKQRGSVQRKVVRKAMKPALRLVLVAAKSTVPERKRKSEKSGRYSVRGLLKASLGVRAPKAYPNGTVWSGVGPRGGGKFKQRTHQGRKENPTQYAHLSEGGTTGPRAQRAQWWYRRAWGRTKYSVQAMFRKGMTIGMRDLARNLSTGMPARARRAR